LLSSTEKRKKRGVLDRHRKFYLQPGLNNREDLRGPRSPLLRDKSDGGDRFGGGERVLIRADFAKPYDKLIMQKKEKKSKRGHIFSCERFRGQTSSTAVNERRQKGSQKLSLKAK